MQTDTKLYDLDAEKALLGAFYLTPELLYEVEIVPADFWSTENKKIYTAMLQLFIDGISPDMVTICNTVPDVNKASVIAIATEAATSANAFYHAKIIKDFSDKRRYLTEIQGLLGKVEEDNFLQTAEKTLLGLQDDNRRRTITVKEALGQISEDMLRASEQPSVGIQTGFARLNDAIVGLCPRHLWLLGAYTSYGKSTFLSQVISDICIRGAKALIFSVEDSINDKLIRLMATKSDIPIREIVRGRFDYTAEGMLSEAMQEIKKHHLHIYDDIYTLDEMELKIKKHKLQGGLDVVAIDFVQNILTGGESIYDRMSETAIRLQRIAKKHEVNIFALSQISEGKEKGSINLRGAQELASAADIVLWIDRQPDEREFNLIIRKNRPFGKTGKIPMTFNESWTGIQEA